MTERDTSTVGQYPTPVDDDGQRPVPSGQTLLLSGLLWADVAAIKSTAELVQPGDLPEPHGTIYAAVVATADKGTSGPRMVLDKLTRDGDASEAVRNELVRATVAGGIGTHVRHYAAAVLADRFRSAAESFGTGVVGWAETGSEDELWAAIVDNGTRLRQLRDRLTLARGGAA